MKVLPKLMAAILAVAVVAAAVSPWRLPDAAVLAAVESRLARDPGLLAGLSGPVTFKLLPRPRIQAANLTVADRDGVFSVDAPAVRADIDIPGLLAGHWRLLSVTLVEPTVTMDLDRVAARPQPPTAVGGSDTPWPEQMHIRSGVLRTRSSNPLTDTVATALDATVTWPRKGDALVFSGVSNWRGTTVQFAGSLDSPELATLPDGSSGTLQLDSPLLSLAASGRLSGGTQESFVGHVAASTPALPRLLRTLDGHPIAVAARRAQISGDLLGKPHDLSLSNAQIKLDRAKFEGTLAVRRENDRNLVAGTLATDLLDVNALFGDTARHDDLASFYHRPFDPKALTTDVDIRISASAAKIGRLSMADTAFSALLRAGRLELTLDEAGAYGGLIKARAIANLQQGELDTHADLSADHVDLGQFSDALSGQDRVGGTLTGGAVLDGRGPSLSDVVASLGGHGQVTIDEGRLTGLSLGQVLRHLGRKFPIEAERRGQPTTFGRAKWDFSISGGVLRIPEGKLTAPGVQMSFGAETTLPDGRIAVHAVAAQTDGGGAPVQNGQRLPFDMRGSWEGPLLLLGHAGTIGLPFLTFPLLAAPRVGP